MQCLTCQYDLSHLPASPAAGVHRYPECGRIFNPEATSTYHEGPVLPLWRRTLLCIGEFIVMFAFVGGMIGLLWKLILFIISWFR